MGFRDSEDSLVVHIIGYTLTKNVSLNVGFGNFERISQESKVCNQPTDNALMPLLKGPADLIQSPTEEVNRLSEAPKKQEAKIPPFVSEGTACSVVRMESPTVGYEGSVFLEVRHLKRTATS